MLSEQINNDINSAMKSKEEDKLSVLRMLKAAIKNGEIQQKKEFEDNDILGVIQSQIKSRRDSIDMYKKGGRVELAEKEEKEIAILSAYLPEQMSEDEIRGVVKNAISKTDASQISDMGKVMGVVMPEVKGKADGATISKIVKEELSEK
jgi:hypothetical protein